jgi:ribosomal protein S18 acetylase RimI-like enzyme
MEIGYNQYHINIEELNLPDQNLPERVSVCNLSEKSEFNRVLSLFLRIFPDEIDSEKADDLQNIPISQSEGIFIAKLDQLIIGFLITGVINQVGYISYIGVLEQYRSSGVATALLEQFKSYLCRINVDKIRCKVKKDNFKTLGYIEFLGFKKVE